ncbi:MAG: glycosyltransferase family 2 protein [Chloroflexota bacterium]
MTACSIVIRAYNEGRHIGRLLEGIQRQTMQDVEIVLVDSGSTDETLAIAGRYPVRVVHIRPQDFTFGYSLNQGIAAATAEAVVIASAHVYPVYPDWLERLLAPLDDPHVGLTYGRQRGNGVTRFSEAQIFQRWFPAQSQSRQYHPFCNNANAAIRRALWQQHPYDETLPGLEDLAWANWMMAQGHALSYVAEAEIVHVHDETPRGVYNRYRREAMAFKRIFPQERFHLWNFAGLFLSNAASDCFHAARQKKLSQSLASILWFRWMQFWGTYRGYRQSGPLTWQLRQTFYYPHGMQVANETPPRQVAPIRYEEG